MNLKEVDRVENISGKDFQNNYYRTRTPLVLTHLAREWPAYEKWNWEYFKQTVGDKVVGIYNNQKSNPSTPVNQADDYIPFGQYIDMVSKGPAEWRIFLFNIFKHAPHLTKDFIWPEHLMKGFIKRYPVLFVGGAGSITHMHFDMDMSHLMHTQFLGRKRLLLFPFEEQYKLYRKPFEVLSEVDFSHYHHNSGKPDYNKFPAVKMASGYELILEHGDTLFMPAGYFHHVEYLESGFAMSLRAVQRNVPGLLHGAWNVFGMRNIDTLLKKLAADWWYEYKKDKLLQTEGKVISRNAEL